MSILDSAKCVRLRAHTRALFAPAGSHVLQDGSQHVAFDLTVQTFTQVLSDLQYKGHELGEEASEAVSKSPFGFCICNLHFARLHG